MKKIITASMALLSVVVLAACAGKTTSDSSTKNSSFVEKTSSETSSTTSSSKTENNEVVLITDEEIENAKTVGEVKNVFGKLVDNYKKYAVEIGRKFQIVEKKHITSKLNQRLSLWRL